MRFTLSLRDFLKGALMAILVPVIYIIQGSIQEGAMVFNWGGIWKAALGGFIAYLIKNFCTDDVKTAKNILAEDKLKASAPKDRELNP